MANWNQVLDELNSNNKGPHDHLRLKYLKRLHKHTKRNIIVYYSGWLQKNSNPESVSITDLDKTGFMTCSHDVKKEAGLDLILHTPGGDVAATESLIEYLGSLYDGNIRAIVPQLAMSGGTLIALSCREIIMGRQSSIGPVDPQIAGMPAQGIVEEFEQARSDITGNPNLAHLWQPILSKYWPSLVASCRHAITWSDDLLKKYLEQNMLSLMDTEERGRVIGKVSEHLGQQATSKSHNRHIGKETAREIGLRITDLEEDQTLQDLVLTLHHALTHTFSHTAATKIIENHKGIAYITT